MQPKIPPFVSLRRPNVEFAVDINSYLGTVLSLLSCCRIILTLGLWKEPCCNLNIVSVILPKGTK